MALGTPLNRMQEVAAEIPTAYLSGTRDPLAQWDVLDTLQTGQPGNVHVVRRPDLGHLATVHARQEAGRVHDAHLQLLGVA